MNKIFLTFGIAFLLVGCGGAKISADRPTTGNIVVFGASITEGYGVEDAERYPDLLQAKLDASGYDYQIINQGVSGHTTADGLERIEAVLEAEPEIVIVALGGNDFLQGRPLNTVKQNLDMIVRSIREIKADVLLVGVTAPPTRGLGYTFDAKKVFSETAEEFDVPLMPNYLKGIMLNQQFMLDQVHPNPAGHQKLADNMWEYLEPMLRQ